MSTQLIGIDARVPLMEWFERLMEMTRIRKVFLAGFVSLLGVVGTFAVQGAANAQSGSRLCGKQWQTKVVEGDTLVMETLIKLYETNKEGGLSLTFGFKEVCEKAKAGGGSKTEAMDAPDGLKNLMRHEKTNDTWPHVFTWETVVCESFTDGTLNNSFEFVGDGFPGAEPHQDDVCQDMNRSDTILELEAYWLLKTQPLNANGQPNGDVRWFMQRD